MIVTWNPKTKEFQYLITNLPPEDFSLRDVCLAYHLRWQVEMNHRFYLCNWFLRIASLASSFSSLVFVQTTLIQKMDSRWLFERFLLWPLFFLLPDQGDICLL
jgi:hypothetical protein